MSYFKNLSLIVVSIFLTIFIIEGGTRLILKLTYGRSTYGQHQKFTYSPYLIHSNVGKKFTFDFQKQANDYVILIIGGSTARRLPTEMIVETFSSLTNKNIHVFNLGSGAFITNQEIVALSLYGIRLKPDLIISLNGANDMVSYTKTNKVGTSYYESIIKNAIKHPFLNTGLAVIRSSQFFNVLSKLKERPFEKTVISNSNIEPLIDHYINNIHIVSVIAKGLSIPYIAVLQPHLQLKPTLSDQEQSLTALKNYAYRKAFFQKIYPKFEHQLQTASFPGDVFIVSGNDIYSDSNETCFIDEVHLSPTGNITLLSGIVNAVQEANFDIN